MLLVALYAATIAFRPLLPIDETRYMSAAWEMYLRGDWLAPLTVNFQPYHHKPPLLFWLINSAWSIFGVSRWAGTLPVLISSIACLFLTKKLGELLFPDSARVSQTVPILLVGSLPFLLYSQVVMFDITLTVFVLLSLIALVLYAKAGQRKYLLWMALAMGLGVLTKGPVAWLYVIFPILAGPLWIPRETPRAKWYGGCALALVLSVIPVSLWLIPVLLNSSDKFAFWLIWEQTAGRVTGDFNAAHARPLWFYLPYVPVLFLPWLFFPSFWKGARGLKNSYTNDWGVRFLAVWISSVFIAFSLISGKQPHYLVPLLPGVIILMALWIKPSLKKLAYTASAMAIILCIGQGIASQFIFEKYDLKIMAGYLRQHPDQDLAFVPKYHGELTFTGRLKKPIDSEQLGTIGDWLKVHPNGLAIIRYENEDEIKGYKMLFNMPYRGNYMGVFKLK
ncbi:ArnT family glycosyltransferase [Sneathiella sp.]|uniref:ArnT family glycosyltransferase n=1 Tax=Sneathiella sp. TaxID=1964365 RepID=UPI0035684CB6